MDSQVTQIEDDLHFTAAPSQVQPPPGQPLPAYQNVEPDLLVTINSFEISAPIHALPPEILGEIFLMANLYCVHGSPSDHDAALLRVCRSWRELALCIPLLWSHIDLICDGEHDDAYYNRARVWIERSGGVPLDIDIRLQGELRWAGKSWISNMTAFLAPLSGRVQYCAAGCDTTSNEFPLQGLLSAINHKDTFQTLEILHLWSTRYASSPLWRWSPPPMQPALPLLSHVTEPSPSPPARVLRLENILVLGSTGVYSGLTELYVDFPALDVCRITRVDIAWVLASSPALRLFSLINVDVGIGFMELEPILLSNLHHMTLVSSSVETFENLELLVPMEQPLSMSASTIPDPDYINAMRSFFSRSNVTSLHCTPSGRVERFVSIPEVSPQLGEITFEHFSSDDPLWPTLLADYGDHLAPGWSDSSLYRIITSSHTYLFC